MVHTDVIVVGGGVIGFLTALRLRQRGLTVRIIERTAVGAEASSAAAGILAPHAEAEADGPLFALARKSLGLYPELAAELKDAVGIDIGYRIDGSLVLAANEEAAEALRIRYS